MTREQANAFIKSLVNLRAAATDEQANNAPAIYPAWDIDVEYKTGDRVLFENILYKVLQDHTSQETWIPTESPSLFTRVLIPDEDIIPEWEQPDSTNPYMTGDKVTYEGKTYESTVDNNVWKPTEYGWEEI
jgi:chitodextrinase